MVERISYRTSFAKAFHRTILVAYTFFIFYEDSIIVRPEGSREDISFKAFGGKFKYLTSINLIISQFGYFALAVLTDLTGTTEKNGGKLSFLQRTRDFMFTTIVFPLSLFVCSIFWGIYVLDKELIFPERYNSWYPMWANHFEHSLPAGAVLLEMLLVYHRYPKSSKVKVLPLLFALIGYFAWVLFLKFGKNINVYPFFTEFNEIGLVLFLASASIPAILILFMGSIINTLIWGTDSQSKKKDGSKQKNNSKNENNKKGSNKSKQNGNAGKQQQQRVASDTPNNKKQKDADSAKKKSKTQNKNKESNQSKEKNSKSSKKVR